MDFTSSVCRLLERAHSIYRIRALVGEFWVDGPPFLTSFCPASHGRRPALCLEGKNAVRWMKLSCRTLRDNQTQLQLSALAFNLANFPLARSNLLYRSRAILALVGATNRRHLCW